MSLDPLGGSGPHPANGPKVEGDRADGVTPPAKPAGRGGASTSKAVDQIHLSAEVSSAAGSAEEVPRGELTAARLLEIGRRLGDGFYDSGTVLDQVSRAVLRDLEHPGSAAPER
ncbi:MAG: hypothetical protein HOP28_06790 [Gemmatimonadales bacterium]|nr:hypothetical protein [Gemmatimonadales bacterium]